MNTNLHKNVLTAPCLTQFCTCDVENFGDVLYPLLFKYLVEQALDKVTVEARAFLPGLSALGSKYPVYAIRELFHADALQRPLVIGGGDILRIDDAVVASHYRSFFPPPLKPINISWRQGNYQITDIGDFSPQQFDPSGNVRQAMDAACTRCLYTVTI